MKRHIAIVGCGDWGKKLVRNFNALGALHSVCDVDPGRIDAVRAEFPGIVVHSDIQSQLQDPEVKGLGIATPVGTHHALAKLALSAGKDVFVEKPLALRYEEGEELVNLAASRNRILMVGHILAYHPAIIKLKNIIDDGELGKIHYIYSNRLNLGKFRREENILWSFAPHDISVIIGLIHELPASVSAAGGNYLRPDVADITVTNLNFSSGVKAHIFVSWLHPYKEQKIVVIGDKKMALFDDLNPHDRLFLYDHKIDWIDRSPVPRPAEATPIKTEPTEPLRAECEHFLECIQSRKPPRTDGREALGVLRVLEAAQLSLKSKGNEVGLAAPDEKNFFVHETAVLDEPHDIGAGTKVWHFSHILKDTKIGRDCVVGQNASIGPRVNIGNNVRIQNNVSIYEGVTLEDDVFCGPSMVFTNVLYPRSHWPRKNEFKPTLVRKGASLGANSTIICGITIGRYAFVGAGAVVNKDVPDYALVYGVPARMQGWMCYCGEQIRFSLSSETRETAGCQKCGRLYHKDGTAVAEVTEK